MIRVLMRVIPCVVAGCSFSPGALREDASDVDPDVGVDVPGDAAGPNCYAKWFDGTIRFGTPMKLANVNGVGYDRDPFLTPDERSLYFSSIRSPNNTTGDVLVAKRPSTSVDFSAPQTDSELSSTGFDSKVSITADGLYAVIASDRAGSELIDVWELERAAITDAWSAATRTHMTAVNTPGYDLDPTISADGLRLYLAVDPGPQKIAVATRSARDDDFGAPQILATIDSNMGDADPSPTPDERILVFASSRTGSTVPMQGNIWYSTRASSNDAFGAAILVPDINSDVAEGDPHLSTDGCRIYFDRQIAVMNDDWDLFVATALP